MECLAAEATETFQCCEAKGREERCKRCNSLCAGFMRKLHTATPSATIEGSVVAVGGVSHKHMNLHQRFAGGGFSIVFAPTVEAPAPQRGQTRLQALTLTTTETRGVVFKACDSTDVDMCRPQLIETVIAEKVTKLCPEAADYVLAPVGGLFKLPMPQLEPEYLYATAYPRCDGDLLEMLSAEMLSEEHLFYIYSVISVTLNTLQEKIRFSHGDLKFENIFFRYTLPRSREVSHGGLFATFHNIFFTPIISDFGMSSITVPETKTYLATDFWGKNRKTKLIRGGDMCFLTMCLLSVEGRELRKHALKFHSFLWSFCNTCPAVADGIRAMRDQDNLHLYSDSEAESDDEGVRGSMKKAKISSGNYDRAMYIITNSLDFDLDAFIPLKVFEAIVGLRMLDA